MNDNKLLNIHLGGFSAIVDACARRESEVWFISLLGAQQAVKAIWARLVKGETAYLSGTDSAGGYPCWLAREAWGTWRFHQMRLPSGAAHHGMLVPDLAAYRAERREFLLLARANEEAPPLHYRFLNRRIDLPLHPSWCDWLWERALANGEGEALDSSGVSGYLCRPDPLALQTEISQAVRKGYLGAEPEVAQGFQPAQRGT